MTQPIEDKKNYSSITEHLVELRSRLIKIAIVLIVLIILLMPFLKDIMTYMTQPMLLSLPQGQKMSITGVLEGIIVPFKILITSALIISLPFTLYQIWAFIAPGLYAQEKKIIFTIVLSSFFLFFLGMAFCYFVFFPLLFTVTSTFTPNNIAQYIPTIGNYLSFILNMFIVFGISFQVPIIMLVLNKTNIVATKSFKNCRSYAIIAAFAIAAITTPPDVISQFFLAIPLILLYETGLIICRMTEKKN